MAITAVHGIYLALERQALARGDKDAAARYRQAIRTHMAANRIRRRQGSSR